MNTSRRPVEARGVVKPTSDTSKVSERPYDPVSVRLSKLDRTLSAMESLQRELDPVSAEYKALDDARKALIIMRRSIS